MYRDVNLWLSSLDLAEYFALFSEYFDFVSPSVSNLPELSVARQGARRTLWGSAPGTVRRFSPHSALRSAPCARWAPRRAADGPRQV